MRLPVALVFFFLVSADLAFGSAGEHHGITPSQIKNLIWLTVNFLVLVMLLYKLLRKPIIRFLNQRKESIQREYEELLLKKREAEAQYLELQEKLNGLEDEAKRMLQNYIEQGQKEKERIIKEAEIQAQRLLEQADLYLRHELEKAKDDLRSELAQEVIRITEERLLKGLTLDDHKQILLEVVENLRAQSPVRH